MRPLAALLGIVMGSSVALLAGLVMTLLVFLLLPEFHDRLAPEFRPLLLAVAWAVLLTAVSAAGFVGELHLRRWRWYPQLATAIVLLGLGWHYWPA
ncbi:MAG TPA: hypothetical protein VEQ17_00925 [Steroidobacteraceae bacterium]|nr:hypothetical protein [Steroidobacteraceae bacterium]